MIEFLLGGFHEALDEDTAHLEGREAEEAVRIGANMRLKCGG